MVTMAQSAANLSNTHSCGSHAFTRTVTAKLCEAPAHLLQILESSMFICDFFRSIVYLSVGKIDSVSVGKLGFMMGAQWVEHQNTKPKTLGSIPWSGRVRDSFSVNPSQILCRFNCFCPTPFHVYGKHPFCVCMLKISYPSVVKE